MKRQYFFYRSYFDCWCRRYNVFGWPCGLRYAKRPLMSWVIVIPKEGRARRVLVWHRLFRFFFFEKFIFGFFFFLKIWCHTKRRAGARGLGTFSRNGAHELKRQRDRQSSDYSLYMCGCPTTKAELFSNYPPDNAKQYHQSSKATKRPQE